MPEWRPTLPSAPHSHCPTGESCSLPGFFRRVGFVKPQPRRGSAKSFRAGQKKNVPTTCSLQPLAVSPPPTAHSQQPTANSRPPCGSTAWSTVCCISAVLCRWQSGDELLHRCCQMKSAATPPSKAIIGRPSSGLFFGGFFGLCNVECGLSTARAKLWPCAGPPSGRRHNTCGDRNFCAPHAVVLRSVLRTS